MKYLGSLGFRVHIKGLGFRVFTVLGFRVHIGFRIVELRLVGFFCTLCLLGETIPRFLLAGFPSKEPNLGCHAEETQLPYAE